MKPVNLIVAGAALAAGLVGGTATYLVAAQPAPTSEAPPARTTEVSATSTAPTVAPSKPIIKLAPCKRPAVREGKACVTEVVETVVLAAPSSVSAGTSNQNAGDGDHWSGAEGHDDDEHDSSGSGDNNDDDEGAGDHDDGDHDSDEDEGDDD